LPNHSLPGTTAFPFFDNLIINNATSQGIYYSIYGNTHNRTIVFEYYTTLIRHKEQYCHFQVLFFEDKPNIVQFKYLTVSDSGNFATIGVQGKSVYE
jgi:hypothetical protein